MTFLYIIAILLLLGGSAFFSAAEMALSAANPMRLESMAEDGSRGAKLACRVREHYDNALSAILIGNNLCNIASDSLVTMLFLTLLGDRYNGAASALITVGMTAIIIVFCESAPKIAAKKNANRVSVAYAPVIRILMVLLTPLIRLVTALIRVLTAPFKGERRTELPEEAAAELQSILETVEDEGVIDEERGELLRSALDFSEIAVMDVMTARVDMDALSLSDDWREKLLSDEDVPYSRLPVYEDSVDDIVGVLPVNRFFRALSDNENADIRDYLMKPLYVYKTVKLPDVLTLFRKEQQHLAVVTDEYGGTLGIVTLEDVLEQLVGEIWDENDVVETEIVERPDGVFELDGDLPIGDFAELIGRDEDSLNTESATVGGWTIEKFGAFPKAGDTVESDGVRVRVLSMDEDGRRVERVLAERTDDKSKEDM